MLRFLKSMILLGLVITPLLSLAVRDSTFLETTNLKCISDGIETFTGQGSALGLTPSPKYLALLGFGMQRFHRGANGVSGLEKEYYQQKVIEFIQANGYCLANRVDGAGRATAQDGYGDISGGDADAPKNLTQIVLGTGTKGGDAKTGTSAFSPKEIEKTVKYFGFKNMDDIKDIFYDDNWSGMSPQKRQDKMRIAIENPEKYATGLNDCLNQMHNQQQRSPVFKHEGKRSPQIIKLCEAMANECGLENKEFCTVSRQMYKKGDAPPAKGGSKNEGGGPSIYDGAK